MLNLTDNVADNSKIFSAKLLSSDRITPESSREEVRQLLFSTNDIAFDGMVGSCIRVHAPGQYGNRHHTRLYSLAEYDAMSAGTKFALCVRRCSYVDDFNGQEYEGVASNYLCNLKPGSSIEFSGPVGYPFTVPSNPNANLLMIGMGTGIAPFRGLVREIYKNLGGWNGKVRLFHGARTGLELLYLNDANSDLADYVDEPTFKAFQAVSPRPALDVPIALDKVLEQNAAEVWEIVNSPDSRVFVAGMTQMLEMIDTAMANIAGSVEAWTSLRSELVAANRWLQVLY